MGDEGAGPVAPDQLSAQVEALLAASATLGGAAGAPLQAVLAKLRALRDTKVSKQLLQQTQSGKKVKRLAKHPSAEVAQHAQAVVEAWMACVQSEARGSEQPPVTTAAAPPPPVLAAAAAASLPPAALPVATAAAPAPAALPAPVALPPPAEATAAAALAAEVVQSSAGSLVPPAQPAAAEQLPLVTAPAAAVAPSQSLPSTAPLLAAAAASEGAPSGAKRKAEEGALLQEGAAEAAEVLALAADTVAGLEQPAAPRDADRHDRALKRQRLEPPPHSGDPQRDKVRAMLADALALAVEDVDDGAEVVGAVAAEVEMAVHRQALGDEKRYKAKLRSLHFNLKDAKNPDLRRRVLARDIPGAVLVELPPEELASDERRGANAKIRQAALKEAERGENKEASTDQFQCGRCRQRRTRYYQLQTRSADEPMTTFVTCVNCGKRWKFC